MHTDLGAAEILARLAAHAKEQGRDVLLETEGLELLKAIGIPLPAYQFVPRNRSIEAGELSSIPSASVVVKVVSPEILHKSDVGGVRVVSRTMEEVNRALVEMQMDLGRFPIEGFLVLEKIDYDRSPGGELLAGLRWTDDFGPVVTIYVYPEDKYEESMELCNTTSPYALTGAIFARDRFSIVQATRALRNAAGNFYINDKPTGAVVGQQPFGSSRASGTNDKAGTWLNLERWVSPRSIKETYLPATDYRYPFMEEE